MVADGIYSELIRLHRWQLTGGARVLSPLRMSFCFTVREQTYFDLRPQAKVCLGTTTLTKLTDAQLYHVQISPTKFRPHRSINVASMDWYSDAFMVLTFVQFTFPQ